MRLVGQECLLKKDTFAWKIYGAEKIVERHRHHYEVNILYIPKLEKAGLYISEFSKEENLCEMVELPESEHLWFMACQFHPEFTSTPRLGHPLFKSYVQAAINFSNHHQAINNEKLQAKRNKFMLYAALSSK